MLFFLDVDLHDWVCLFDGATLMDFEQLGEPWLRPANSLPLRDEEVRLSRILNEFPGFEQGRYDSPRYRLSNQWSEFIA